MEYEDFGSRKSKARMDKPPALRIHAICQPFLLLFMNVSEFERCVINKCGNAQL